ncbi:hypothetical protein HW555_013714 [Spodoptera exigua]|uniref:Uncharacterized protein n=1 Tax=Spodoptera exigua TaxID=7107 RepID=A0A835KXW1_SPOEX|nr:hypothetical protein HW555_013714 [Spodoptera exigua]
MAIYSQDFEHIHTKVIKDGEKTPDFLDESTLMTTAVVTILDGGLNVIWFAMSIVLLIGLHRKRPGHIKVHVSAAVIRLLLSILCMFFHGSHSTHSTLVCSIEIVFSAYFILLYYSYAILLEREQQEKNPKPVMEIIASVISKHSQSVDKVTLTEREEKFCPVIYSKQYQSNESETKKQNDLFTKYCFCVPLETGCFILGYTSLFLNFIISLFFFATLAFLAAYTHGFQYLRTKTTEDGERVPDMNSLDNDKLTKIIVITVSDGSLNLAWFAMCIVLLLGLHKKQPGYIKLHVSVAAIRVLLSIVGVALYTGHTTNSAIFCVAEIVISAFFILLYYRYANQLKKEQLLGDAKPLSKVVSNVTSKYPQNIDKAILTEKKEKY